jgi:hypothetical protein
MQGDRRSRLFYYDTLDGTTWPYLFLVPAAKSTCACFSACPPPPPRRPSLPACHPASLPDCLVCACVRACVRACACMRARACVRTRGQDWGSDAAPAALSWSAQNAPAKEGRPLIAAACCLRGASTASRGCQQPLEARARAHSENNSVFPYIFSGPEADFGRWP